MNISDNDSVSSIGNMFSDLNFSRLSIPDIRFSDVVDILIVAIFIYIIMNWIRETRAWSLFKGIIVILVLSILSFNLNLYTTYWIIEKTLSVGIIAILILFQPEFRKGLEQIGKGSLTKNIFNTNVQEEIIPKKILKEILDACFKMSMAKTGAIIVVEKSVALGDFEENGIPIDAIVSSQLLLNIFENKTPLHDGAVTIRNGRISKATCILPLTRTEIGHELGTRHRAGVGASEVCDGYVFIVSEETGFVSLANNGRIYKNLNRKDIENMFKPKERVQNKINNIKINNIWKGKSK